MHAAVALLLSAVVTPSFAQSEAGSGVPSRQFGVGIDNRGGHVQYALVPGVHFGVGLDYSRLQIDCFNYDYNDVELAFNLGVYAKYLFPAGPLQPYALAGIELSRPPIQNITGECVHPVDLVDAREEIYLALGGEHFFNRSVGIYGQVRVFTVKMDPEPAPIYGLGLMGGAAGVEFFF